MIYDAIVYVGLAFFFLFSGHSAFRSLLPAMRPVSGPWLVALNFAAYAVGSLLHPRWLSSHRRLLFLLGALAHVQWIASLQLPIDAVDQESNTVRFFIAIASISSILNGFGAGLLWATYGGWMAEQIQNDPEISKHRAHTGIFLAFYGISGIVGNSAAAAILAANISVYETVWYLFAASFTGCICFALMPVRYLHSVCDSIAKEGNECHLHSQINSEGFYTAESDCESDCKSEFESDCKGANLRVFPDTRWSLWRALFTQTNFLSIVPAIVCLSAISVLTWVSFPPLLEIKDVPIAFILYAISSAISPLVASRFLPSHELIALVTLWGVFIVAVSFANVFNAQEYPILWAFVFFGGFLIGTLNNIIYEYIARKITLQHAQKHTSLSAKMQEHLSGEAFCIHGFIYCLFFASFSGLSLAMTASQMTLLVGIIFLLNSVFYALQKSCKSWA
jgi:hypothetical protein